MSKKRRQVRQEGSKEPIYDSQQIRPDFCKNVVVKAREKIGKSVSHMPINDDYR